MLVLKNLDNPTFTAEFPRKFRHLSLLIYVKNFLVHFLRLSFQIKFTVSEILFIRIHGGRHPTPRLFVCLPPLRWGPRDSGPTFRYLFTHTYGQFFLFTELAFSCRSEPLAGLLSRFLFDTYRVIWDVAIPPDPPFFFPHFGGGAFTPTQVGALGF